MINPSRSWETFIKLAQSKDDMSDVGGGYMGDLTAKSVGSKVGHTYLVLIMLTRKEARGYKKGLVSVRR